MHEKQPLVINTSPLIALIAATGSLGVLEQLYQPVFVTKEVKNEICAQNCSYFGANAFTKASFLTHVPHYISIAPMLNYMLDSGEASVIQYALDNHIALVCIDEATGRRIARLNDLSVTGSLGILLKAKKEGYDILMRTAIKNMQKTGIFLSNKLIEKAIILAGE